MSSNLTEKQVEELTLRILQKMEARKIQDVEDRTFGLITCGAILGIILSYSSLLGYSAGVLSGLLISNRTDTVSRTVLEKVTSIFHSVQAARDRLQSAYEEKGKKE